MAAKKKMDSILIFSDGACSGNPGPGGWGVIVATPEGFVRELGGFESHTTNNRMELSATIAGLRAVRDVKQSIQFFTDSTYVIRGITQWIWGWKKNGWKNKEGIEVLNKDLWVFLSDLVLSRTADGKINWLYSRGHVGTPGNERCDEIAVGFSQKKRVNLYEGPLLQYNIAVYDLPENTDLPEMKPIQEKKEPPFSYLSLLGGEVWRHKEWAACERRVKGRSGAKFKKALKQSDEKLILESWGLDPGTKIQEN